MENAAVLLSLVTDANDFQREQASAAREAAGKLGINLTVIYANSDPIVQSEQLLQVIQSSDQKPKGILVQPAGGTALPQVAQAAARAGIAWGLLNRQADYIADLRKLYSVPVFAVSSDQKEIGRIQGRQLSALLPNGGNVLYLQGPPSSSASQYRAEGMNETRSDGIHVKTLRSASWTTADGGKAIASWLRLPTSQKEHIDVIAAQGDMLAMGARQVIHEQAAADRARFANVLFTGVDGLPHGGRAWVQGGTLAATVVVPLNAGDALKRMLKALQTGIQPEEISYTLPASWPAIEELERQHASVQQP